MSTLSWSGSGGPTSTEPGLLRTPLPSGLPFTGRPPGRAVGIVDRYEDLGLLALGGMGEIRSVFDRQLRRTVAMKLLRNGLRHDAEWAERFRAEALLVARLQHPAIVPVLDCGVLPDGRSFFTMPEISGRPYRSPRTSISGTLFLPLTIL